MWRKGGDGREEEGVDRKLRGQEDTGVGVVMGEALQMGRSFS